MKNLIRGHIYQLKKDNFFFGCLALSFVFLIVSIRFSSQGLGSIPVMGVDSLISTFLNGDIILYAFMLLTANMVAEAYRSGVMKNIIGRGISKKKYYGKLAGTVSPGVFCRPLCGAGCSGWRFFVEASKKEEIAWQEQWI